jgi:hypothetical protein
MIHLKLDEEGFGITGPSILKNLMMSMIRGVCVLTMRHRLGPSVITISVAELTCEYG